MKSSRSILKPGDVLGRYQLLVPIGEGGMGRVWVAREQGTGRMPKLVALKTTLAEHTEGSAFWTLLLDEARIASQIRHPNVCGTHALENEGGVVYLVMEWSDGGSLRELLDALPVHQLAPAVAVRIAALVASGLHAAHELIGDDGTPLHVVHRDVSPQNILLSSSGQIKIIDFGVAKARGQLHAPTETGHFKGKISYMAPEQVTGKDVDCRADVFALGCVLYEATVGERPFRGSDTLATLYQLIEQPVVPPSARCDGYPVGLERIVLKALARDASERFQTAREFGRALESWLASEGALVTEARIAELVREALGARIDERAARIRTAIADIDSAAAVENTPAVVRSETASEGAVVSRAQTVIPAALDARPTLRTALAVLTVALGAGAVLALRQPGPPRVLPPTSETSAPTVPASAQTTSASAAPPIVSPEATVTVRVIPSQATLYLDDGPALPNPFTTVVAPDNRPHRLRATAPGFVEHSQEITLGESQEIAVTLHEIGRTAIVHPPHVVSPPALPPTATPAVTEPSALPTKATKPPRVLDPENPFGPHPGGS